MPASIHASIPAWVPAVLLGLLALGWRLSRTRTVRPAVPVAIAVAMFAFSLYGVASAFGVDALALRGGGQGLPQILCHPATQVAMVHIQRRWHVPLLAQVALNALHPGAVFDDGQHQRHVVAVHLARLQPARMGAP
mgnify:CR=1 FL=1